MKKIILLIIGIIFTVNSWAYSFVVNGIYYNITSSTTVDITYKRNYNTYSGTVVIPSSVSYNGQTYSVTRIGESAFVVILGAVGPTSVSLPNTITKIGRQAFSGCTALSSIVIPNSVDTIDYTAFNQCSNLASITFPDSLIYIGDAAFGGCSCLLSINLPSTLKYIGSGAFKGCTKLTTATTPMGDYTVFGDCPNLKSIIISEGTRKVVKSAFTNLPSNISSITIPASVQSIDTMAFYRCVGLTTIDLPSSLTSIGMFAFAECNGFTSIKIPISVTSFGLSPFRSCKNLNTAVTAYTYFNNYPIFDRC